MTLSWTNISQDEDYGMQAADKDGKSSASASDSDSDSEEEGDSDDGAAKKKKKNVKVPTKAPAVSKKTATAASKKTSLPVSKKTAVTQRPVVKATNVVPLLPGPRSRVGLTPRKQPQPWSVTSTPSLPRG